MAWYIRKAFRLGPLRLNLSKRGVGASAGVTGARVGVDAVGRPYVHAGRHGLYYRRVFRTGDDLRAFAGVAIGIAFGLLFWLAVFAWLGVGR